jgi:hypothetical protein
MDARAASRIHVQQQRVLDVQAGAGTCRGPAGGPTGGPAGGHAGGYAGGVADARRQVRAGLGVSDAGASGDVGLVLRLLRALFLLSRDWFAVAPPSSESSAVPLHLRAPLVPPADFVNVKLAAKLMRQLQVLHRVLYTALYTASFTPRFTPRRAPVCRQARAPAGVPRSSPAYAPAGPGPRDEGIAPHPLHSTLESRPVQPPAAHAVPPVADPPALTSGALLDPPAHAAPRTPPARTPPRAAPAPTVDVF